MKRLLVSFCLTLSAFGQAVPGLPTGAVARWKFPGLGLAEGATISSVPDLTGNGNALAVNSDSWTSTHTAPQYTYRAINGRGGFWPGTADAGASINEGSLKVTLKQTLTENNFTILFAGQFGGGGSGGGGLFAFGNTGTTNALEYWEKSPNNSISGIATLWYTFDGSLGKTAMAPPYMVGSKFAGPVAGAIVNGFGGTGTSSRFMLNRFRQTNTSFGWRSAKTYQVFWLGAAPSNTTPEDAIYFEVLLYPRALTDAELDQWQVYCRHEYGSPVSTGYTAGGTVPGRTSITERVDIWCESVDRTEGVDHTETQANLIARQLGNYDRVEYINAAVGGTTLATFAAAIPGVVAGLYDSALQKNVMVLGCGNNDISTQTGAYVWSNSPSPTTGIADDIAAIRALSGQTWKIVLVTNSASDTFSGTGLTNLTSLNGTYILPNWSGVADSLADYYTPLFTIQQNSAWNHNGHPNNGMTYMMSKILAVAVGKVQ